MMYMVFQFVLLTVVVAFSVRHMIRKFTPKKAAAAAPAGDCASGNACATCGGCMFANLKTITPSASDQA